MAEMVGEVFVRVHADTAPMIRELARQQKKFAKASGAENFQKSWDRALSNISKQKIAAFQRDIQRAAVSGDFSKIEKDFGGVRQAAAAVREEVARLRKANALTRDQAKEVTDALKKWAIPARAAEEARAFALAMEHAEEATRNTRLEQEKLGRETVAINARTQRDLDEQRRKQEKLGDEIVAIMRRQQQARAADRADEERTAREIVAILGREERTRVINEREERRRALGRRSRFRTDNLNLQNLELRADRVARAFGSIFGRGARNNFVNLVGNIVFGIAKIGSELFKTGLQLGEFIQNLAGKFNIFGDSIGKVFGAVFSLAGSTAGLIIAAVALALVFSSLDVIAGLAAASISFLAGAITTAAAALSFAISGFLLPLIPALLSLGPAILVAVRAFQRWKNLFKPNKDVPASLTKAKKAFDALKVSIDKAADSFLNAFAKVLPSFSGFFTPLINATGAAMAQIATELAKTLDSPGFKKFSKAWQQQLPQIFLALGRAANFFFTGFIKFFTPILPIANLVAKAIERIAKAFDQWASKPENQKKIGDFMRNAAIAAELLGQAIVDVVVGLAALFGVAQRRAGDSLLTVISNLARSFREFTTDPKNQKKIEHFFDRVRETGGKVFDLINRLWNLFNTLDTEEATTNLQSLITFLGKVVTGLQALFTWIQEHPDVVGGLKAAFGGLVGTLAAVGNAFLAVAPFALQVGIIMLEVARNVITAWQGIINGILLAVEGTLRVAAAGFRFFNPILSKVLTDAADDVGTFRDDTNKKIDGIKTDIDMSVNTLQATKDAIELQRLINSMHGKTITVNTFFVTHPGGPPPGSGKGGNINPGAAGMLVSGPTNALIGEAGPEAVVPLNRALALVDPAVRQLSAIAQGKTSMANGGVVGTGKSVTIAEGAIVVNTTSADPRNIALSVLDRFTAAAV